MIITIDGPAAGGKSTIAFSFAKKFSFYYINSGLLYRASAYIIEMEHPGRIEKESDYLTKEELNHLFTKHHFEYHCAQQGIVIKIGGIDVTQALKSAQFDNLSSKIGGWSHVRGWVMELQQLLASKHDNVIIDGRDA